VTLMDLLVHFHRYDFVYFDHHRVTRVGKKYGIWRKIGKFWGLIGSESDKIRAFARCAERALCVEVCAMPVLADRKGDEIRENATTDTRNRELPELDRILLLALRDDPITVDMLRDVMEGTR
jgi:hypothetical protein